MGRAMKTPHSMRGPLEKADKDNFQAPLGAVMRLWIKSLVDATESGFLPHLRVKLGDDEEVSFNEVFTQKDSKKAASIRAKAVASLADVGCGQMFIAFVRQHMQDMLPCILAPGAPIADVSLAVDHAVSTFEGRLLTFFKSKKFSLEDLRCFGELPDLLQWVGNILDGFNPRWNPRVCASALGLGEIAQFVRAMRNRMGTVLGSGEEFDERIRELGGFIQELSKVQRNLTTRALNQFRAVQNWREEHGFDFSHIRMGSQEIGTGGPGADGDVLVECGIPPFAQVDRDQKEASALYGQCLGDNVTILGGRSLKDAVVPLFTGRFSMGVDAETEARITELCERYQTVMQTLGVAVDPTKGRVVDGRIDFEIDFTYSNQIGVENTNLVMSMLECVAAESRCTLFGFLTFYSAFAKASGVCNAQRDYAKGFDLPGMSCEDPRLTQHRHSTLSSYAHRILVFSALVEMGILPPLRQKMLHDVEKKVEQGMVLGYAKTLEELEECTGRDWLLKKGVSASQIFAFFVEWMECGLVEWQPGMECQWVPPLYHIMGDCVLDIWETQEKAATLDDDDLFSMVDPVHVDHVRSRVQELNTWERSYLKCCDCDGVIARIDDDGVNSIATSNGKVKVGADGVVETEDTDPFSYNDPELARRVQLDPTFMHGLLCCVRWALENEIAFLFLFVSGRSDKVQMIFYELILQWFKEHGVADAQRFVLTCFKRHGCMRDTSKFKKIVMQHITQPLNKSVELSIFDDHPAHLSGLCAGAQIPYMAFLVNPDGKLLEKNVGQLRVIVMEATLPDDVVQRVMEKVRGRKNVNILEYNFRDPQTTIAELFTCGKDQVSQKGLSIVMFHGIPSRNYMSALRKNARPEDQFVVCNTTQDAATAAAMGRKSLKDICCMPVLRQFDILLTRPLWLPEEVQQEIDATVTMLEINTEERALTRQTIFAAYVARRTRSFDVKGQGSMRRQMGLRLLTMTRTLLQRGVMKFFKNAGGATELPGNNSVRVKDCVNLSGVSVEVQHTGDSLDPSTLAALLNSKMEDMGDEKLFELLKAFMLPVTVVPEERKHDLFSTLMTTVVQGMSTDESIKEEQHEHLDLCEQARDIIISEMNIKK